MENRKLLLKHMQQGPNQCGPTALAIVMDYWGMGVRLPDVVHAVKPLDFMFSASYDLIAYARQRGLVAEPYNACTWEEIKRSIRLCVPPIALVDPEDTPDWNLHYVVINGFLEDGMDRRLFYIDPGRAVGTGQCEASWAEFSRHWEHLRVRNWATGHHNYLLLIAPSELAHAFPPYSPARCYLGIDRTAQLVCGMVNRSARALHTVRTWLWYLRPRRFNNERMK